jgi:phage shock protein A
MAEMTFFKPIPLAILRAQPALTEEQEKLARERYAALQEHLLTLQEKLLELQELSLPDGKIKESITAVETRIREYENQNKRHHFLSPGAR